MSKETIFSRILRGDQGALKRALYKSMGWTHEQLSKPIIGIVNTYTNATPGHYNLNRICEEVRRGVESAGGTAMEFGTIAICDGIAEGHDGMRYVLPSRDLIASSVEAMAKAHAFDGLVLLGSCDKIVPGLLMAAARVDVPAVFANSGPMYPAEYKGKHYDGNIVTEAIGWKQRGLIDEAEFKHIEDIAEPCHGSCAMLGTANTMCCLAEAMGMALPGSASIPAVHSERLRVSYETGRQLMRLVREGIRARHIMNQDSLENAARVLLSIGGSTNAVMHLQAIYKEAGLGEMPLETFGLLSRTTPQVASVYPSSPYDMVDFHQAGGVPAVMKSIEPLLHTGAPTVNGKTVGENLNQSTGSLNREVIRPLSQAFSEEAGLAVLAGNLAPDGSVIKTAGVPETLHRFEGTAVLYDSEQAAIDGILAGEVKPGSVIVLRYEGPKGGPGMPEMYRPMKSLEGMGLADSCALITDGRFSGSNRGCFVGHISPEAQEGGAIGLIEPGDVIRIDIPERKLELLVEDEELRKRRAAWVPVVKEPVEGFLGLYRQMCQSAAKGAVLG